MAPLDPDLPSQYLRPIMEHRKPPARKVVKPYEVTLEGDMRTLLAALDDNSIDAIVCDPPYSLGFMGKSWDKSTIAFDPATWAECLRVLKPGGYLVAFGATRTSHRITCAIEDAGFEIRDTLQWIFGSGYPKSLDVGKALDKAAGAEREVVGMATSWNRPDSAAGDTARMNASPGEYNITAPATEAARTWDGYGTALKPAYEPITLARKPLDGTVAENVTSWGTGGIDVDGCRVGDSKNVPASVKKAPKSTHTASLPSKATDAGHDPNVGRWPPNIILGDGAGEVIDGMSGVITTQAAIRRNNGSLNQRCKGDESARVAWGPARNGGASEFFPTFCYTPKANRKEREAGLAEAGIEPMTRADVTDRDEGSAGLDNPRAGITARGEIRNTHPTVKPVAIMRWLVRLVSPPRELAPVILDPFMGSGSTGVACVQEGVSFIGIELDPHYHAIAQARIDHARKVRDLGDGEGTRRATRK